ncbi:MAG: hypothetical protein ACI8QC_002780 [Planctomycetota bacterium]|jgi:hypothetical protein
MSNLSKLLTPALALAFAGTALAQGGDDCSIPTAIGANGSYGFDTSPATTSGFNGGGTCGGGSTTINQDLFWVFTAPAAGDYVFDTFGSSYDTKLSIHNGFDCNATCADYNDDTGGLQSEVSISGLALGDQILVQIGGFGSSFGSGTLNISTFVDPCAASMDDNLEENDDCGQEASIGSGTFNDLFVSKTDWDYYSVDVLDGDTLQVDILFIHSLGDMDIFLYESGFCQSFAAGNVGCTSSLVCGFSASDNEQIVWTNNTGSTQTYTIKVNIYPPGAGDCNDYDMTVSGADGMGGGGFGTNYCGPGVVNSSGMSGIIGASGSNIVADNNLIITASQVPTAQFAYMIASRTQGFVANPGGSTGNLCVLGDIARFNRAGEVGAIVAGEFSLVMPLGDFPEPPTNGVSVLAGDVWNFQCWHRDIAGGVPTSNFTDAVEVTMQ